jgi:YD repeat-containing protein
MSSERLHLYDSRVKDSDPSSVSAAARAYFRWQYALGSYEYAERHRIVAETRALRQVVAERYEAYRRLQEHEAPDGHAVSARDSRAG